MESQYNHLLSTSKTVCAFYENVYAPVLQTLPWLDEGNELKSTSEKVFSNLAFPAYEISSYKNQEENEQTMQRLRDRCTNLERIYEIMWNKLRVSVLTAMPAHSWDSLREMVPAWGKLSGSEILPYHFHKAVEHFVVSPHESSEISGMSTAEAVLAHLLADKIKSMYAQGESDQAIALTFGSHGFWLDRRFLDALRMKVGTY